MRMQEPEQSSSREWQANRQDNGYYSDYPSGGGPEQQEYIETVAGEDYQQQKIHPQQQQRPYGTVIGIFGIILSSIGFFLSVAGIVVFALVLKYADGRQAWLAGGLIGLLGSIFVLLVCVAIFVLAVVMLALRARKMRRMRARM